MEEAVFVVVEVVRSFASPAILSHYREHRHPAALNALLSPPSANGFIRFWYVAFSFEILLLVLFLVAISFTRTLQATKRNV
jgi:hypothetical protein